MNRVLFAFAGCVLPLALGCNSAGTPSVSVQVQVPKGPTGSVSLDVFIDLAKKTDCAEISNRIFLVDQTLVFRERKGNCPDNSYYQALYGSTPQVVLCESMDSIAGPQFKYHDESHRAMFDTILANLDKPDLGLGAQHTVVAVPF